MSPNSYLVKFEVLETLTADSEISSLYISIPLPNSVSDWDNSISYKKSSLIFQSTLLLKVVTHEKKINDEKTEYQYQQYEIKNHDSTGWEYTPNAPIFIEVLDNNEIVVKIDGKAITKTPLVSKTVEATEIEKDYYEKYVKKALDVCTVVGTVAAVLAIPGVIVLAI